MFRAPCAHHQEVKIALHSLWYHHTETIEWSKITVPGCQERPGRDADPSPPSSAVVKKE